MQQLARDVQDRLGLEFAPVGFRYVRNPPPEARPFASHGCIAPLVRAAGQGKAFVLTPEACGWPCAAFYLGFSPTIFPGVELFLSHGPLPGRTCERFVRTPAQVTEFLDATRFQAPPETVGLLAPLGSFSANEPPEIVILLANPDQLSALVFLLHYDAPTDDRRVITQFASACCSMITVPLRLAREGKQAAVWGLHDLAARARLPAHLMSLAMPLGVLTSAWRFAGESFLGNELWSKLLARNRAGDVQF